MNATSGSIGSETEVAIAASALNEQGYLLQHKIHQLLLSEDQSKNAWYKWAVEAVELPISLPDDQETRVDLVLRYGQSGKGFWRAAIECKRSAPEYKRWIFFGQPNRPNDIVMQKYFLEYVDLAREGGEPMSGLYFSHRIENFVQSEECPIYCYGVEARLNRPKEKKRVSATEAIEEAFQQVMLAQIGLVLRLKRTRQLNFRVLPIVVTTAQLYSAEFSTEHVSEESGTINASDLKLTKREWIAVNHRISDVLCEQSRLSINRTNDLAADLVAAQIRTIFVVQSAHLRKFLSWVAQELKMQ